MRSVDNDKKSANDMEHGATDFAMGEVAQPYKFGPLTLPAYRSPLMQTILIGIVCFLVVGKTTSPS